jgi:lipoate-protein ligase B
MADTFEIRDLGLIDYDAAWALQKERQRGLIDSTSDEVLFICEHPPVITLGNGANVENLLASEESLAARGISVRRVERGGDVTFHGPGQLVAYPIVDLRRRKTDVGWYMRLLESCIITALKACNIQATQIAGKTGVWVLDDSAPGAVGGRKIASIGVRLSRWCTMHGLALYLTPQLQGFNQINPCGMPGIEVTSVEQLGGSPALARAELVSNLISVLDLSR